MEISTLGIRRSVEGDGPELEALDRRVWSASTTPAPPHEGPVFGAVLPFDDTLVADEAGVIVGYATIGWRTALPSNAHVCRLRAIAVHSDHRRNGVGRALLLAVEREGIGRGCQKLGLSVLSTNPGAVAFYRSLGYEAEGIFKREFHVDGRWVDDLSFAKWLDLSSEGCGTTS